MAKVLLEVSTAAAMLQAGQKTAAETMIVCLTHIANDQALGFEFQYCRFEPSRFT